MSACSRIFGALLALGCVANAAWCVADDSWFWGASGARTTYSPPYDPSDAPPIPLLKRSETASDGKKTAGPRVGDSGTFVGEDGKTYYYRFVEGVRRRAVVETRPDASSPSGWRKTLRYVDEPRLIKQIWPAEIVASTPAPEPCRPVENVVEAPEENAASGATDAATGAAKAEPTILYRATVRAVVP
jgi:hypothetical protein